MTTRIQKLATATEISEELILALEKITGQPLTVDCMLRGKRLADSPGDSLMPTVQVSPRRGAKQRGNRKRTKPACGARFDLGVRHQLNAVPHVPDLTHLTSHGMRIDASKAGTKRKPR